VVYRVLSRLFAARDEEPAGGAAPPPMSIDEAHYYFPQEGAREDFNKEAVINKLTRLGRVRRMGVVFATHSPADLNVSSGGAERRSLCLFRGFRLVDKGGILPERRLFV
jgi:DNA helicase HerA-like ATPase